MDCAKCKYSPAFLCCGDVFLCKYHLGEHFESRVNHQPEKLVYISTREGKKLKKDIVERIKDLSNSKSFILNETNKLILRAQECAKSSCEKIDTILERYLEFIKYEAFFEKKVKEIEYLFANDIKLNGLGLKLEANLIHSYDILLNDSPKYWWTNQKKLRYAEMMFGNITYSAIIKTSNDGKMMFECNI